MYIKMVAPAVLHRENTYCKRKRILLPGIQLNSHHMHNKEKLSRYSTVNDQPIEEEGT
jgi:hypothetical protein